MLHIITIILLLVCINAGNIPQHRVKSSKRVVQYSRKQHETSKFWIPSNRDLEASDHHHSTVHSSRQSNPKHSLRARMRESWMTRENETKFYWFVHTDASSLQESPESYYYEQQLKRRRRRRLVAAAADESSKHDRDRRRRHMQVDSKFASSSSGSDVQVGSSATPDDEDDKDLLSSGTTGNSTEDGWNVTSQVENNNQTSSNETSTEVYTTATNVENGTTSLSYQPIRIRAILSERDLGGTFLNDTEREILFEDILRPAILAWSAALRVDPVVGNLTVDAEQLYDGETCGPGMDSGLPSVPVPSWHLTASAGIPDTDLVVYLSISFSEGEATEEPQDDSSSSFDPSFGNNTDVDKDLFVESPWNSTVDKELSFDPPPTCSGDYLAAASYCSTDQYDRPTAGMLHLCIDDKFFSEASVERNIMTVMHELGHVLGFNSQSFAHFRRSDGSPITPRNDVGDVIETEVECTGTQPRRTETIPLPSEDILQFRTVRGVRVAEIVTPSVRQVVRNHFDCQSLIGAELESGVVLTGNISHPSFREASCIGDHLEKRLFRVDLMNPNVDEVPFSLRISSVALALLADSGWYQVDLSRTAYPSVWGRGAGCSFVEDSCVSEDGEVSPSNRPFFCNSTVSAYQQGTTHEIQGCSPDLTSKATCSMSQYESDLPTEYQYFNTTFGSSIGGSDPFLDYCPVYSGFSNGACRDRKAMNLMMVSEIETFGRRNARCVSGRFRGATTAFCLSTACVIEDRSLRVEVDGEWKRCSYSGQVLYSDYYETQSTVFCPDPVLACPAFYCQRDCLGTGGICDYMTGACVCESFTVSNTTATNSTNGTLVVPPGPNSTLEVESGLCDDFSPSDNGHFYSEVQDSRSPLADPTVSDYYYPTEEDLDRDDRVMRRRWIIVAISIGGFLLLLTTVFLAILRYLRARRSSPSDWFRTSESSEATTGESSPDVNKDKFVASMLVDMRMHAPQDGTEHEDPPLENVSETDRSLTETDGSEGFTVSSLARSESMSARSSSPSVTSDTSSDPSTDQQIARPEPEPIVQSVMRKRIVKDECK